MNAKRLTALILLLSLTGCTAPPAEREYSFFAFGTLVQLTLVDVGEADAERARAFTARRLRHYHQAWHPWRDSPLTRLNAALAAGESIIPNPVLQPLIRPARQYAELSGGLFNPAIGSLIALWGFHSDQPPVGPPPLPGEIAALVAQAPVMADLVWHDGRVSSRNPALQLDFGAFAKGVAVERITGELHRRGFGNLILNAGGDLKVLGTHGDRPWRVGVRDPDGTGVYAAITARPGEAVFTSGDYERYFTWHGKRYHHLIDPRTGRPARGARSVTVITRDAALGDAAATALFVAGPQAWPKVARRLGVEFVLMVDAAGHARMTPGMAARIQFEIEPEPELVIQGVSG